MEDIYVNVEYDKPVENNILKRKSTNETGPRSSERRFHAVVLCLGLLSVLLLAGLIGLGVTYARQMHDNKFSSLTEERDLLSASFTEMTKELNRQTKYAELYGIKANLTERLQISDNKFSSLTEERDLLNANLTEMTKELNRLKCSCPEGWMTFSCACYFLSTVSGSWEKGQEDCRDKGADLVVISSAMEQNFLTKIITQDTWIGLNDRDNEGTWKWTDGTPLTQSYWRKGQPDNGGGDPRFGEEDCAHFLHGMKSEENWNDLRCNDSLKWICEKMT